MLHFNQRNWFKMFPQAPHASEEPGDGSETETNNESLPEPKNRKEFYLSLLAGNRPKNKEVIYNGLGTNPTNEIWPGNIYVAGISAVINSGIEISPEITKVFLDGIECEHEDPIDGSAPHDGTWFVVENDSGRRIAICKRTLGSLLGATVYIVNETPKTPPRPKTVTEFYLAKMAGVEVVDHIEKIFEQEFTFEETGKSPRYSAKITNAYDETVDISNLILHIDGIYDHPSFNVNLTDNGTVYISTDDGSYTSTTHTLELFYKTVVEDVPVKTRTEKYLKAIAAKQDK